MKRNNEIEKIMNLMKMLFFRNNISELKNQINNLNVTNTEITGKMLNDYSFYNKFLMLLSLILQRDRVVNEVLEKNTRKIGVTEIKNFNQIGDKLTKLRWADGNTRGNIQEN